MNILIEILLCLASAAIGWYAHLAIHAKENRELKSKHKLEILELESRLMMIFSKENLDLINTHKLEIEELIKCKRVLERRL